MTYLRQNYLHRQAYSATSTYLHSYSQPGLLQAHPHFYVVHGEVGDGCAHAPTLPQADLSVGAANAGLLQSAFRLHPAAARFLSGATGATTGVRDVVGHTLFAPVRPVNVLLACVHAGQR